MISLVSDQNEYGENKHDLNINILINLIVIMTLIEIIIIMTLTGLSLQLNCDKMTIAEFDGEIGGRGGAGWVSSPPSPGSSST